MATFVLVAGANCGGWIWRKVAPHLRRAGHDVYTPTLTGLGERAHLATADVDLDTHVSDVVNVLRFEDLRGVTLVGHALGTVVAGVAERAPERLALLVYADAAIPEDGQSHYDLGGVDEEDPALSPGGAAAAGVPGCLPVPERFVRETVMDAADQEWVVARLTPHPVKALAQPVRLGNPAAAAIPRAFVRFTEGASKGSPGSFPNERLLLDPQCRYREVKGNHMALVNAPRALAEALVSLVEGESG